MIMGQVGDTASLHVQIKLQAMHHAPPHRDIFPMHFCSIRAENNLLNMKRSNKQLFHNSKKKKKKKKKKNTKKSKLKMQ